MPSDHVPHTRAPGADIRPDTGPGGADDAGGVRGALPGERRIALRAIPLGDDGGVPSSDGAHPGAGPLPGGGRGASGAGHADGDPFRTARGRGDREGPNFDIEVPPRGYAWWYVDGVSDDGARAISAIGFIGSVFSPWFRWSRQADPANNCCLNVATYGPGGRFAMTDRGRAALGRSRDRLTIGPSSMHWTGRQLVIEVDEISSPPFVGRMRGTITVTPGGITDRELLLTPDGAHVWRPFAPASRIEVDLGARGQWSGHGYFDSNFGTRPLEEDFSYWTWGRYPVEGGSTCFYDTARRDGTDQGVAIRFDDDGTAAHTALPPKAALSPSRWRVRRETRADPGYAPRQVRPMLDAPFYARSVVRTRIGGYEATGVHEAIDFDRFKQPLLMPMLAVRVPRRPDWSWRGRGAA